MKTVAAKDYMKIHEVDRILEYRKWTGEIPFINFPSDWQIQITPAFGGAVCRFRVKKDTANVSVYLDCYSMLGVMEEPYWEIYPHEGDCFRCFLNETDILLTEIANSIKEQLV
jgi:hypothetical protein